MKTLLIFHHMKKESAMIHMPMHKMDLTHWSTLSSGHWSLGIHPARPYSLVLLPFHTLFHVKHTYLSPPFSLFQPLIWLTLPHVRYHISQNFPQAVLPNTRPHQEWGRWSHSVASLVISDYRAPCSIITFIICTLRIAYVSSAWL